MEIREIQADRDLEEIARWFLNRKWPYPVIENIGPGFGLIAEEGEVKYACAWIYLTGRGIAYIDWLATNPDVDRKIGAESLNSLVERIKELAKVFEPEIKALCFFTKNKALASQMEFNDFRKEEGYSRLLWTSK
jgi:hypothetical protein